MGRKRTRPDNARHGWHHFQGWCKDGNSSGWLVVRNERLESLTRTVTETDGPTVRRYEQRWGKDTNKGHFSKVSVSHVGTKHGGTMVTDVVPALRDIII